jgi:hypothetical protein
MRAALAVEVALVVVVDFFVVEVEVVFLVVLEALVVVVDFFVVDVEVVFLVVLEALVVVVDFLVVVPATTAAFTDVVVALLVVLVEQTGATPRR